MTKYCNPYPYEQVLISYFFKPVYDFNVDGDELLEIIVSIVCKHFKITTEQLRGRGTKRELSEPRHITAYLLYKYVKGITQVNIGRYLNRDHSTIINSIKCVNDFNYSDKAFKSQFEFLEREVLKAITN